MSTVSQTGTIPDGSEPNGTAVQAPPEAALDSAALVRSVSGTYALSRNAAIADLNPFGGAALEQGNGHGALEAVGEGREVAAPQALFGARPIREELRLDVDGRYPQRVVSGTIRALLNQRLHWIARLTPAGAGQWKGPIFYKEGSTSLLRQTAVHVTVSGATPAALTAKVTFTGSGGTVTRIYKFGRSAFRDVEFEFDTEQGQVATKSIHTHSHPTRPAGLPGETLSLDAVYARAGFQVTNSGGNSIVPTSKAGTDARWTDQEMHDAMQLHWSQNQNAAQWSLWVLWARQHIRGRTLGGIMFDDIGPNHRQGTAIFNESFVTDVPPGDANPAAWRRRMLFWTAAHEMGHAFNLAHSWEKSLGTPWIPLADEPEARSFMNYPFNVAGGQSAFFRNFEYRFSNPELLFMRHAPEKFVQMGNADWFDHHGFEQAETTPESDFELTVRMNRDKPRLAFLEPAIVELKLKNVSGRPQVLEAGRMRSMDAVTLIVKRRDRPARQWRPYARYCVDPELGTLDAGASLYESLFIAAGPDGWLIDEPGTYTIQAALHLNDRDVVSNEMQFRVAPPRDHEEEDLAGDLFTDSVGRIFNFGGSLALGDGNDALREAADRLDDAHPAGIHARFALGNPLASAARQVVVADTAEANGRGKLAIEVAKPDEQARELVESALRSDMNAAAETFGHIGFRRRVDRLAEALERQDLGDEASALCDEMLATLRERGVPEHVLQPEVAKKG
jgi:hypothetical protein